MRCGVANNPNAPEEVFVVDKGRKYLILNAVETSEGKEIVAYMENTPDARYLCIKGNRLIFVDRDDKGIEVEVKQDAVMDQEQRSGISM